MNPPGNVVIVLGDANNRYNREEDNFENALLQQYGLSDPWIELVKRGDILENGNTLTDRFDLFGISYEVVDKNFYRSNQLVFLKDFSYKLDLPIRIIAF